MEEQMKPQENEKHTYIYKHDFFFKFYGTKWTRQCDYLHLLQGLQQQGAGAGFGTPALDDNARAVDNLAGLALGVNLAQADPLAELLAVFHLKASCAFK